MKRVRVLVVWLLVALVVGARPPMTARPPRTRRFGRTIEALVTPLRDNLKLAFHTVMPPVTRGIGTLEGLIGDAYYYGHWSPATTGGSALVPPRRRLGQCAAQGTLGDMYYYGRDVPQDFVSAATWWQLPPTRVSLSPAQPQRALRQWRRRRAGLRQIPHVRESGRRPAASRRRSRIPARTATSSPRR